MIIKPSLPYLSIFAQILIDSFSADQSSENLAAMIQRFNETQASQIMLEAVAEQDVNKYGIADINGTQIAPGESAVIKHMVEKPKVEEAPSNLAVVGRYVLSRNIWPLLKRTPVGAGGEIQLTDAIDMLIAQEPVEAFRMSGISHDCGDKLGYMKAFVRYAQKHPEFGEGFNAFLQQL